MLYVCVSGVMDVVFSACIVTRGAVGARVWGSMSVFVMQMLKCLYLVCIMGSSQC